MIIGVPPDWGKLPPFMYQWAIAQQERRGIPMDGAAADETSAPMAGHSARPGHANWIARSAVLKSSMAGHIGASRSLRIIFVSTGMSWPTLESGELDETDQTFREMAGKYPHIEPLRELRYSLSKLRLNDLSVGSDHRNRAPLWAYGTKTGRNAPGASQFVFGPAKWLRFLISPPPGRALVHRDFSQQEMRIAAVLSGDSALLEACESGDVYFGVAQAARIPA